MNRHRTLTALTIAACALAGGGAASAAAPAPTTTTTAGNALLQSRALWATVNVCNTRRHPDVVGIRGSMPGNGNRKVRMFMRFQLQYQSGGSWVYDQSADSGFVPVGTADYKARQSGVSFTIKPAPGGYVMRGVVTFQWRRGAKLLLSAIRNTEAGHRSVAGADPPGYSAAACSLP